MKLRFSLLLSFILLTGSLLDQSIADNRRYVWTYEYQTMPRGKAEIEHYTSLSSPDIKHLKGTMSTEHQIEVEIGMTDHFDFSIYQKFNQAPNEGLRYDGYKLRARYRIGEKNHYFVDPLIYLEYIGKPDFSEHGIELKLILAKDFDRLNISFNPIIEFEREDEWETEPKYALGASYKVAELLSLGLEAKGGNNGHYFGPVISHGNENYWFVLGSALKLGTIKEENPEFQIRMILGLGL